MLQTIRGILSDHWQYRKQLFKLAKADLKKDYGGALGIGWAVIRPAILIFVFWFAFTVGLRRGNDVNGYPFFLWLIAGMIPWYYMRDMLTGGAGSIRRYRYLVTKIKFPISTIPTFVSIANMVTHLGLVLIMMVIYLLFGYPPTIYYLQLPLYTGLMFLFFTSWGLFSGMLSAVSRDFYNLVRSLTQAVFWLSGILYDASRVKYDWIRNILLFNPVTLLVNGYRDVFINHRWFWENPEALVRFALVYAVMGLLALWAYRRLYKDVPDVL